jgi:acyl carrier protein
MLDRIDMTSRISELVRQAAPDQAGLAAARAESDLYDSGLNSMAMVKLMLSVEAAFDIAIPDADLHPDNFRTISAIGALVVRLRGA